MNFEIVDAEQKHIESLWAALDSVAKERKYLAFLEAPHIDVCRQFWTGLFQGGYPCVVAMCNDQVVGWCDISPLQRPIFAHVGSLGMGVTSSFRGKGIGKALMGTALARAKARGLTRIELSVVEHNDTAISLYEKFGFVKEGLHIKKGYVDGQYQNHIFMALIF